MSDEVPILYETKLVGVLVKMQPIAATENTPASVGCVIRFYGHDGEVAHFLRSAPSMNEALIGLADTLYDIVAKTAQPRDTSRDN